MNSDNITSTVTMMTTISIIDIIMNLGISVLVYTGELWPLIHLVTFIGISADAYALYETNLTLKNKEVSSIP